MAKTRTDKTKGGFPKIKMDRSGREPDANIDGMLLPPPDNSPTENWDSKLESFLGTEGTPTYTPGDEFNIDQAGEFSDSVSGIPSKPTVTVDDLLSADDLNIDESYVEDGPSSRSGSTRRYERDREEYEDEDPPELAPIPTVDVSVEVPGFGEIPVTYADFCSSDRFLLLAVHPDHRPANFTPPRNKEDIRSISITIPSIGKKYSVVPLCSDLVSGTNPDVKIQLFQIRGQESLGGTNEQGRNGTENKGRK